MEESVICWECGGTGKSFDANGKEIPCPKPGCTARGKRKAREAAPDWWKMNGRVYPERMIPKVHKMSDD